VNRFLDRTDAGRQLAVRLASWHSDPRAIVVGLARGGVVVAAEVAAALDLRLDVLVVRKIGVPGREEVAMGALGEGGVVVVDEATQHSAGVTPARFAAARKDEEVELDRRVRRYRAGQPAASLADAVVLIVDDGVATGATARAACRVARMRDAARVVLAVPVAARTAVRELRAEADEVVVLIEVGGAFAVGEWYDDFNQTSDAEVLERLATARRRRPEDARGPGDGETRGGDATAP
jgi:putative phosphoribosyl transferase